jgi:hypothetical protein
VDCINGLGSHENTVNYNHGLLLPILLPVRQSNSSSLP